MQLKNIEIIKEHEQLRLKAYLPTKNDKWTIGWGHTKGVKPGMVITEREAEQMFYEDLAWVEAAIKKYVKVPLNQNQYDAVGSFVFNIGETNFARSTFLRKLNAKDYTGAANEFPKWKYQKGVVLNGLVRRRADEKALFEKPVTKNTTTEAIGGALSGSVLTGLSLVSQDVSGPVVALSVLVVGLGAFLAVKKMRQ